MTVHASRLLREERASAVVAGGEDEKGGEDEAGGADVTRSGAHDVASSAVA